MASSGDAAFAHCRQMVAEADKVRYWATLYAPEDRRHGLFALYAFDLELAAIGNRVREPIAGEIRLQWWREALEGKRGEEATANPVAVALLTGLKDQTALQSLLGLIEARRFDVYDEPMETVAELETYGRATAGAVFHVAMQLLGATNLQAEEISTAAGIAQTYLTVALTAPREIRSMPREILDHYGAERGQSGPGGPTFALRAVLAEMRLRARQHLGHATPLLRSLPQQALPALLPVALIRPTLALMERQSYDPLRPPTLSLLRKQWLIWRAARNPVRIFR